MNSISIQALRRIMSNHLDDFNTYDLTSPQGWDNPGDLHDTVAPKTVIWSLGDVPKV